PHARLPFYPLSASRLRPHPTSTLLPYTTLFRSQVVTAQFERLVAFAGTLGLVPKGQSVDLGSQLLGGVGRLTSAVGTVIGGVASVIAMVVIGIFLASEPKLYDRGIAWMLPLRARTGFYRIAEHAGFTLRRLLFGRLI